MTVPQNTIGRISDSADVEPEEVPVTAIQLDIIYYIAEYQRRHGWSPSYTDIGRGVRLSTASAVAYQIAQLEKKGLLQRAPHQARSLRLRAVL